MERSVARPTSLSHYKDDSSISAPSATPPRSRPAVARQRRAYSYPRDRHSQQPLTLGDLVQAAYNKNLKLDADDRRTLRTTLLQRHLWCRLQRTFFAPEADPDVLAALPLREGTSVCTRTSTVAEQRPDPSLTSTSEEAEMDTTSDALAKVDSVARSAENHRAHQPESISVSPSSP